MGGVRWCSMLNAMLGSCAADRPRGGVTLAAAAASALLHRHTPLFSLAHMLGRRMLVLDAYLMLGSCAADRPRGGVTLAAAAASAFASTHAAARSLSCLGGVRWCSMLTRCSAHAQLMALVGVTLAAAAASAFAPTHAAARSLACLGGVRWCSMLARSHAWVAYAGARCLLDARLLRS